MASSFYPYAVDLRLAPFWLPFGLRPHHDGVTIDDATGELRASFGFLRLATPLANVAGAHVTRGYRWWTAAGARLSFSDDGLTFGTNRDAGVCIHFARKVPSRLRPSGHRALTVTVADVDGLAAELEC